MTAPRDSGLQAERTVLAWRRTLLTLATGSLVSLRVLPGVLGGWTVVTGLLGVMLAALLWIVARGRHARVAKVLADPGSARTMPGGGLLLALALFTSVAAALGLLAASMLGR